MQESLSVLKFRCSTHGWDKIHVTLHVTEPCDGLAWKDLQPVHGRDTFHPPRTCQRSPGCSSPSLLCHLPALRSLCAPNSATIPSLGKSQAQGTPRGSGDPKSGSGDTPGPILTWGWSPPRWELENGIKSGDLSSHAEEKTRTRD